MHRDNEGASPHRAAALFETLMQQHPDYVGTYYHAGKTYEQLMQPDRAAAAYVRGIAVSQRLGHHHALRELRAALQALLEADD